MKVFYLFPILLVYLSASTAYSKPSYSFGDEPRKCSVNSDCAKIVVSCHGCNWIDSVNKKSLKESESIVKEYCANWKKQPDREPDCSQVKPVKKTDLLCVAGICEAHTFFGR